MKNTDLKQTYDTMHKTGKTAWFDSGDEERKAILEMGGPWDMKLVLEIGCGEGDLMNMIYSRGGLIDGCDYSAEALETFKHRYPMISVQTRCSKWEDLPGMPAGGYDILVMQGVMEHLDDPFAELADMIERFKPKTIITSMPGFLNTRGIIWHTLDMLGAVMSKTDLHFIDPWEVEEFCMDNVYGFQCVSIDMDWGNGPKMLDDFRKRVPLALRDGNIICEQGKFDQFMHWLEYLAIHTSPNHHMGGAVNIYRIEL